MLSSKEVCAQIRAPIASMASCVLRTTRQKADDISDNWEPQNVGAAGSRIRRKPLRPPQVRQRLMPVALMFTERIQVREQSRAINGIRRPFAEAA
jgi:hypothetical protein